MSTKHNAVTALVRLQYLKLMKDLRTDVLRRNDQQDDIEEKAKERAELEGYLRDAGETKLLEEMTGTDNFSNGESIDRLEAKHRARFVTVPNAVDALKSAMAADPDFAWSWHCNIAMPIKDRLRCSHGDANKAAADLMRHMFDIDMTTHEFYASTVVDAS